MAALWRRFLFDVVRRIWRFLAIFVGVYLASALLFYLLEPGIPPLLALYWGIVTLSTTGYGDVVPTTAAGHVLVIGVLFTQIFLLGYLISVITTAVTEESQKRFLGTLGTDMTGHIIVLGYSPVGRAAVRELLAQEQKTAVVCERQDEIANIRSLAGEDRLYVTYGPPAERDILHRANVAAARCVVVTTGDDTTSMIAALNARALAPAVRVVVSVHRPELRETLKAAGVTYVASPLDMGGRLCASAAFEPEVATALEDISAAEFQSDMQEYILTETTPISRQSVREAEEMVRSHTDCLVIGYARKKGTEEYEMFLNPRATDRLQPGDALLVFGRLDNLRRFRAWFGIDQGR